MSEALLMSQKDRDRVHVIRQALDRRLTWGQAGEQLGLGWRQIARLCARVRRQGDQGALHGLKGRASNRRLNDEAASQILSILHDPRWRGFHATFAKQKLEELYELKVGTETVRRLMLASGLYPVRRRGVRHRAWRERRPCVGMLVQLDGSHHDWFEGRGPIAVLLVYIDDATSRILWAEFVESEDTLNLLRVTKAYIERWGRPTAFYVDKDTIYRVARQKAVDDGIKDEPLTQFKRAMDELGVEIIFANSPQAKGRVERSFQTHQDRLIKELRLADISTIEQANRFLNERYIPDHNGRFALPPANPTDAHRPLLIEHRLEQLFSLRIERVVMNDFTVRHDNRFFQILADKDLRVRPKDKVLVETRLDGSLHLRFRDRYLQFKALQRRPLLGFYATQPFRQREYLPLKDEVRRAGKLLQRNWLGIAPKKVRDRVRNDDYFPSSPTAPNFI